MKFDSLTGLPTHEEVAARLGDGSAPFGVFFDIDALAWATHTFGFAHSDQILIRVAGVIDTTAIPLAGESFRIGGDEFLALLPGASHDDALHFARLVIRGVAALRLEYSRRDDSTRRHAAVNAVVCRVTAALTGEIQAARKWTADMIWQAKQGDRLRVEVLADAGDDLPPWALGPPKL